MNDPLLPVIDVHPPMPGVVSKDAPGPLEAWWRQRYPNQHAIPYEQLTVRKSLRLFDEMMQDETVRYGHHLKVVSRLASGYSLSPPEDDDGNPLPGAQAVLDHVNAHLEQWDRFDEFLEQMLDGMRQGFKLGEIVTKEVKIDGKTCWGIDDVLVRNSRFYAFDTDPAGRILPDGILEYLDQSPDGGGFQSVWSPASIARHAPDKFVRWSYNPTDSNAYSLYGRSDFLSVYRAYFLKDTSLRGWSETLDTYKHPTIVAIAKPGLTVVQRQDFLDALVVALKKKALVIPGEYLPEGMDPQKAVSLHEVTGKADDFDTHTGYLDKVIMRGLLVGQLVSEVGGDGKGSYALGKQHVMLFLKIMDAVGRSLGRAIAETLFKRLIRWNLGEDAVALCPHLRFNAAGDAETLERAQIVSTLVTGGVLDPREPWLREYLGSLPRLDKKLAAVIEGEKKQEADLAKQKAMGGPPKGKASGLAASEADEDAEPEEAHEHAPTRPPEPEERRLGDTGGDEALDEFTDAVEEEARLAWRRVINGPGGLKAQARVAFDREGEPALRIDGAPLLDLGRRLAVGGIVIGAADALADLNLRLEEGGDPVLLSVEDLGGAPGEAEVLGPKTLITIDLDEFAREQGVNLPAQMRALAKRVRLNKAELTRFAEIRIQQVQSEVQAQIERLRTEAREAIGRARSTKRKNELRREFREIDRKWAGLERELGDEQSATMETLTNAAYNEGRMRLYRAAPKGLISGFMYSAILDSRTTDFCRAWDRFRALMDDTVWRTIRPPNHYRCRSKIVAILAKEMSEAQVKRASRKRPDIQPQKGFRRGKFTPTVPE